MAPLVDSVALARLPSTDGAISRSSCCFEVTKSRMHWCRCFTTYDAWRQDASNLGFVKYAEIIQIIQNENSLIALNRNYAVVRSQRSRIACRRA